MSRARPEQQLQRSVLAHLRRRGVSGLWWCHVPNGSYRGAIEAAETNGSGKATLRIPYIAEVLAAFPGKCVSIAGNGADTPVRFADPDGEPTTFAIVMPIRGAAR